MIKSRFTNILSTVVCCILLFTLVHSNALGFPSGNICADKMVSPVGTTCSSYITIVAQSSCNGANSGIATATVYSGTAPYTYAWSNGATGATATGLATGTYTVTTCDKNGCTASQSVSISSVSLNVSAGADKTICRGGSTQLGATGATLYSWTPTTGLSNASIANPTASPTVTTTYTVTGVVSSGELVTNGNFSSGNTGFTSGYSYVSPPGNGSKLNPEGLYAVDANANSYHANFFGTGRGGSGNFMIINGATVAGVDVWRQTINVSPNTEYYFSTWITALNNLVSANLAFKVNGTLMGPVISSPSSPNTWIQFYAVWNSGSATTANISIVNQNTIANGNDFGLDDISFTSVCSRTDQVIVNVNSTNAHAGNDQTVCTGQSATLTATGGGTYVWSTGATTASITVNPASTTTYTVTVTNNSCTATDDVRVTRVSSGITSTIAKTDVGCKADSNVVCALTLATSQHGLFLDDITGDPSKYYKIVGGTATATRYSDGRLKITGTFENVSDVNRKWTIDVMYTNKMNWTEFSARGGTWKGAAGNVGTNYLNWDYYIMDVSYANKLTGSGTYAGKTLNLTHMPSNYLYGFQVGQGANDMTADWGMSGWFEHTGSYTGNGDINFDAVCDSTELFQSSTCNGTANLSISGGTAPITYAWSNGRTTQDLNGLCAGTYTVTITDGTGCTTTQSVTIGTTSTLSVVCNSTDVTTQNGTNGTASVTVAGGVTPYTYLWSTGQTTQSLTNRPAGVYSVTVTDKNGCFVEYECYIKQPSICEGFRTQTQGGWGASPSGGNPGTYLHANFTTAFPSGVTVGCATGFTLRLTSAQAVTDFLPSGSTPRALTANLTNPGGSYSNVLAGQVVALTLSVGFDNANPAFGPNTTALQNLVVVSGTFANWTVSQVLAEANKKLGGCSSIYSFSQLNEVVTKINEDYVDGNNTGNFLKCGIDLTSIKVDVKCFGQQNGSIDLSASGGVLPYAYRWSNGATTQDLVNVAAGTYSVTVTAANNLTATTSVTITQPAQLSLTVSKTEVSCNGICNGTSTAAVSGGKSPYTYSWSNGDKTATADSLCAGSYTVTVTDANSCTATAVIALQNSTQPCSGQVCYQSPDDPNVYATSLWTINWNTSGTFLTVRTTFSKSFVDNTYGTNAIGWAGGHTFNNLVGSDHLILSLYNRTGAEVLGLKLDYISASAAVPSGYQTLGVLGGDGAMLVGNTSDVVNVKTSFSENFNTYGYVLTVNSPATDTSYTVNPTYPNWIYDVWYEATVKLSAFGTSGFSHPAVTGIHASPSKTGNNTELVEPGPCCDVALNVSKVDGTCQLPLASATAIATTSYPPLSYAWSNGGNTATINNLVSNSYTVIATDSEGCTATKSITVNDYNGINIGLQKYNEGCLNKCDGRIELTVSGGSGTYTYRWSNGATTANISALCSGQFTVTVTDNQGCTATKTGTITAAAGPALALQATNVYCAGDCKGAIDLTLLQGQAPITYLWSDGATTQDRTGLCIGQYCVTVTDVSGCKASSCINITEFSTLSVLFNITQPNNQHAGSISTSVYGGTAPYTYRWSNGSTASNLTNVTAGSYSVTVTDANGVVVSALAMVNNLNQVKSGAFIVDMGIVPQTMNNGLKPYGLVYDLVRNFNVPIKWVINPNKAKDGTDFTLNNYDFKGGPFIIESEYRTPAVNARIAYWQTQGVVGVTTTVDITVPVYDCITGFSNLVVDEQNEQLVIPYFSNAGIPSSIYRVGLPSDLDGCDDTYAMPHADPEWSTHQYLRTFNRQYKGYIWSGCHAPSVLEGIFNPANPSERMNFLSTTGLQCYSNNDCGSLITESHGAPNTPYTYDPAYNSDPIMQFMGDLTPSTENGSEQWYIPLSTGRWNTNTAPAITTNNGTAPRKGVKLVFGPGYNNSSYGKVMYEAGHTAAGRGTTASQVAAQRAFFNFLLTASIDKRLDLVSNIPSTFVSGIPQTLSVQATGGTAPYTYAWSTICAGTFNSTSAASVTFTPGQVPPQSKCNITVVVTDACGRRTFITQPIAFLNSPPVKLSATVTVTPVTCIGSCDGTAQVTVTGGTPPYIYTWSNGATTPSISNLCAGTYTVNVKDQNNCDSTYAVTVLNPDTLIANITKTDGNCAGNCDGTAQVTVSGGTAPYTYLWSNAATSASITGLCSGTYTVTATDSKGCKVIKSINVTSRPKVEVVATATPVSCFGGSTGSITTTVTGGTSPFTYIWTPGGATTANLTGQGIGTFTVIVTDVNGCKDTASATITQPADSLNGTTSSTPVSCIGGTDGTATVVASGGTAPYTYVWSTSPARTTATVTGLRVGNYTVTITDAKGCTVVRTVTVTGVPPLTIGSVPSPVLCNGSNTGSINVTISGGTAGYTFLWSNGATTEDITGLTAGTYNVTVTDSKGCVATAGVSVSQPQPLVATATPVNIACFGGNTGSVNVSVVGGSSPFTYIWSNGALTRDITGLVAGTYTVTVTDVNGCKDTVSATVNQQSALQVTATPTDVTCFGFANGSITTAVNGGVAPYTYTWGAGQPTTANRSNLAPDTYNVTVTDANNCTGTATTTVSQPADSLNGTTSSTPVSCIGGTDGTMTVVATGGTAPYTYVWSTIPARTTATVTGLRVGNYIVTITDAKGCTVVRTVTVTGVPPLTIGSVPSPVLCNGGNTGSINLTISGGTPGYTFLWSNGATTEDITGLTAGTYNVTVTDRNGCVSTSGVTVQQPQPVVATATPVNIACFGATNGGVNLSVTGGTTPFTYSWSNGATTQNITGVVAGTYTVTVTDRNGCTATASATVNQQAALNVTATPTDVTCFGFANGSITTAVNGGVAPYTYNWGAGQPTTANRSNLAPGTYNVTVTDANNCTGTATATIAQPSAPLAATAVKTDVNCFGQSTGTVTLTVTGGTTAYTYVWSNGATTQNLTGLAAGTYTVTVTDAKNCTATASATVTQPSAPLAASIVKVDVNCFGQSTGSADLTVTGGTTAYTYLWSNGATTQDLTGLVAGTYTVTITDSKGCTTTATTTITQPSAPLAASAAKTDVNCFGGNNGTVTLTVSGGTTAYTYVWSNGATTQNLTGLIAGTYTVTVTDAKACTTTASATVAQPADSLNGTTSSTPVSCIGGTDGTMTVVATGGTAPYTYVWSTTPARTTATVTGLRVGNYTVTITDAKGCIVVRTITVTGVPPLTIGSVPSPVLCNGGNTGSINLTISGGTPGYTFLWSTGATTEDITGLTAGTYNVTVTDSKGCVATAGVTVNQPQPLVATASPQHIACFGATNGGVNLSVVGGTTPFTYIWSNGAVTRDITGVQAGTYTVTVTDANGCKDTVSATVNQQSALQVTPTPTNVTCFGFNNGSITLAVNGGVTPYTYNWGAGQPTTANRSNLAPGTYNVTVTDVSNCTGTATATITQPADSLNGTTSSTPVSCIGGTDGTATVVATGGTAPYTYVWSTTPARTTASLTGLRAGSYSVTITDAKGCTVVRTVVVTTVPALTVGAVPSPVLCFGGSTGSINATIGGGTPGYTFLWSNGATTEDLSNVAAGTYNVTVTDSKGCVATAGVTITQPQALVATATSTNIPCFGSNTGTVTVSVVGGTTPFTYIWSNGATTRDIAALGAGTYTVTVTDKNGCKDTVSATVTAQPSLVVDVTGTNLLCHESNTGTATANVTGGLAPYTYAWNTTPVRTTAAITGLSIGTYSVTVTDANGCTATDNVVLTQPDSLEALTSCNAIACYGDTTADIVLLVVGGTTPYTYLWSTGATTRNLDNRGAGTYTVTVTDARGCTITSTAIVTQPAQLVASASPLHIACNGAATGGVNLTVVGGTTPYTFIWSNGATTQNLTGLVAGTYTVTVTDANGCKDTASTTINQQSALQVTATPTNIPCFGQNNGSVTTSVNGGVAPYTYNWGAGQPTTANRTGLAPGTYTVTVTDANNCTGTATATVTQPADSLNGTTSSTPVSCIGGTDGTMTVVATGGTAPYTYVWSTTPARTTATVTGLRVGNYTVTITDAKGCTVVRTITVTGVPPLTIGSVPSPVLCNGGNTGSINLTISGGTPGYTFLWSNGATTEDITGLTAGTYNVTVTDRNGCVSTSGVTVQQPQPLVATGTPVNIACFGANNGGVNVSVVGGTSPFTYIWSNGATTRDITGVAAGTYTVTVTDRNGCVDTASATVTQQSALQVTLTPSNVTCFGLNNGSITTAVNGGVAPYTYTWGAGQPTTANRSNLAPGTYNVTVTDANGCTGTATATITQPSATLAASIVKTDVNCFGESTGAADLTVTGGTAPYTYAWSNASTTQDLTALAAGTYTVTVTDAKGCTTTATTTITQPSAPLAASIVKVDVNCFGQSTGSADLTVTGGTTAYTYLWSNGATTQDLTGLVAGTYTVTVTDSKGCTTTASTTITQPSAPLAATAAKTDVNCFGGNNGTITLTVSGGTTAYTYVWSNGATTQNLTGLIAGTYTVTVTDAKACTTTATATVAQPADSLNGTTSSTPVSCIGGTDGTMTVVATGGTAPYTYVWSTTPARTTATVTGLRVGNYTVTITDAKGCTVVRTITVTGVPPLTIGSVPSPVLCNGGNTGSINLTISGGTPGYTFLWSNGATTEDITGLTAGTYNVTVTDRNGCVSTSGVTVQQPQPVVATATPVNIACFGATNGGVNLSVTGGTTPFTYIWSNGATTQNITGVVAGTYTVTVTDRNNCTATATATVNQQSALQVTVTPTNLTCFGNNSGALATTVNGGVAPYTYTWGAGQPTTANRSNLAPGTYNVTVTDGNGCTGTGSATLTQPALLTASATGSAVLCFGNQTGTVDLTVAGGTTAYTYVWSNGATTQDLSGLAAGTYSATVTDANGCTATASATVTQPTLLTASATGSTVNCFGDQTGTTDLSVAGGTAPFTYAWSNGATTQDLSGLAAGTYTATVTDANGCTTTASATVNQPLVLSAIGTNTNVLCNAGNNASITVTVTGGNTPYTFNWGGGVTTQNRTGLAAGTYTVTVTDAKGCIDTESFTITQPTALTATATPQNVRCFLGADGAVNTTVTGGVGPYTYRWSNNATTANLTALRVGTYTVTITDANGCTTTASATVTQPGPLTLGSIPATVSCFGGSNGAINLTVTGGVSPYTYRWSTGATTMDISGLVAGTYNVTVTDANNCVATVAVTVVQPQPITLSFVPTNVTTNGGTNGAIDLSVVGGTSPFTYVWSNGGTTQDLTGIRAGNYCVTVTDVNGCTATGCQTITEPACTGFTASAAGTNVNCFGGSNGTVTVTVTGGSAPFTYNWGGGIATQNRTGLAAGTYTVTITDAVQCVATASVTITQPAQLAATALGSNPTCNGQNNGSVALTVIGGTAPFTYAWSNGATSQNLSALAGGSYTVTVTDANGCSATASTSLTTPGALAISTQVTQVRCFLGADGTITNTISGGTPPYTFRWSNNATSQNLTALRAGSYTVTVTDANGCSAIRTIVVTQPGPLTLGASTTTVSCFQGSNGAIDLSVTGGTAPYVYNWSNGASMQDISGLAAGTYNVTVTDARLCVATVAVNVQQPAAIVLNANITPACAGGNSGAIQLNVVGGTSPFTYNWSNGATTKNLGTLAAGTYAVTVTDNNGCVVTNSFQVGSNVNCRTIEFTIDVILEGPFQQSNMMMQNKLRTQCNTVPLFQPYGSPTMGYSGTESVASLSNDVVDWVLVSFRSGIDRNTEIYKVAGLLSQDGKVRTITGDTIFQLNSSPSDSLYVVVEHRNHMGIMSPVKMCADPANGGVIPVDFTRMQSFITGAPATAGQKVVGTDANGPIYGMHAGDGDCNFDINSSDFVNFGSDFNKFDIYSPGDFNMDCDCNSNDLPKWLGNFNQFSGVR